jgi:hypothetical protein
MTRNFLCSQVAGLSLSYILSYLWGLFGVLVFLSAMLKGLLGQKGGTKLRMFLRAQAPQIQKVTSSLFTPPLSEEGMSLSSLLNRFLTNHQRYILTITLTDTGCITIVFNAKLGMYSLISTPFARG